MTSRVTPNVGAGRIMTTDGGPHPPELWAQVIVDDIVTLGPNLDPDREPAALRLRADLIEALSPLFKNAIDGERRALAANSAHMLAEHDTDKSAGELVAAIIKAVKGSLWETLFEDQEAREAMKEIAMRHMGTVQHIERSWHADRNPDSKDAAAFRALHHPLSTAVVTDEDRAQALAQNRANDAAPAAATVWQPSRR